MRLYYAFKSSSLENVTVTIEPVDTIVEGGMFQVCTEITDFDEDITFSYSISPSSGLNSGESM